MFPECKDRIAMLGANTRNWGTENIHNTIDINTKPMDYMEGTIPDNSKDEKICSRTKSQCKHQIISKATTDSSYTTTHMTEHQMLSRHTWPANKPNPYKWKDSIHHNNKGTCLTNPCLILASQIQTTIKIQKQPCVYVILWRPNIGPVNWGTIKQW